MRMANVSISFLMTLFSSWWLTWYWGGPCVDVSFQFAVVGCCEPTLITYYVFEHLRRRDSALFRRFLGEGSPPSPTSALTSFLAFVVGLLPRPEPRFLWRLDSGILQDKRKGSNFACQGECRFTVKFSRDRRRFPLQLSVKSDSCHLKWNSLAILYTNLALSRKVS